MAAFRAMVAKDGRPRTPLLFLNSVCGLANDLDLADDSAWVFVVAFQRRRIMDGALEYSR